MPPSHSGRIHEVDALRGFALFGILWVNIFVFHISYCYFGQFYSSFSGVQMLAIDLMSNYASGKFLFIFAFLFGFGIALQKQTKAERFANYHLKRMLVLLVFGLAHLLLFWLGDILATYALLGLLLMPFVSLPNKVVLPLGILFLFFRPLYYFGIVGLNWPMPAIEPPVELNKFVTTFSQGSFGEIFELRMQELWAFMPENLVWYIPKTFGLFLLGLWSANQQIIARIKANNRSFFIAFLFLFVPAVLWNIFKSDLFGQFDFSTNPVMRPVLIGINVLFESTFGIAYTIGLLLLFQNSKRLTNLLAPVGRMALTNYMLQSLICVQIFYSYGLGWYGAMQPTDLVLTAVAIFVFNVVLSHLILRFFKQGPLEYLWRKIQN